VQIRLKEIDKDNWQECIQLKVQESQVNYIPSNLYSVAEAQFEDGIKLLGIFLEETMVGFASYILDDQGDMNLYKFMIDQVHQGKGYGKAALLVLMEQIKKDAVKKEVWLSLHPDNEAAIQLYKKYGFEQESTGLEAEDEIFFKFSF
jgi:diamine N-acetyltransferase